MKSFTQRLASSPAAARRVILAADVLFLLSLVFVAVWRTLVRDTWVWGAFTVHVRWYSNMIWVPVVFLLLHAVASYAAEGLDPAAQRGLFRYRFVPRGVLVYLACMIPLMVADHVLKRTDLDIKVAPIVLDKGGHGVEHHGREMLKDPELLWKFEPGSTVYGGKVNSLGFREREVDPRKRPGVRRVICLGDSVTAQGRPGYSQYLHEMLTNAPPDGGRWEAFNMGVYGYSSLQGLRLLELRVKALHPDVVTVSFGRNDHTLKPSTDAEQMALRLSPFRQWLYEVVCRRTVGRVLLYALDRGHRRTVVVDKTRAMRPVKDEVENYVLRVSADEFRYNMRQFVKEIRAMGALPILLTAPRRKIPENYVIGRVCLSTAEFEKGHDEYMEIVRQVARETGTRLADIQRVMAGPEWDDCFARDAIHLDCYDQEWDMPLGSREQRGLRCIAREIYAAIKDAYPPRPK